MKRIKLLTNQFLTLYQTQTDTGQIIAFELCRDKTYGSVPMVKTFRATQQFEAQSAWLIASDLLNAFGPRLRNASLCVAINRSRLLAARNRAPSSRPKKDKSSKRR